MPANQRVNDEPATPHQRSAESTITLPTVKTEARQAKCRVCGEPFLYVTELFAFADRMLPRMVLDTCPAAECQTESQRRRDMVLYEQAAQERAQRLLQIPARLRKATPEDILPKLQGWTSDQSLFLYGPVGTGKSHQVAALLARSGCWFEWHRTRKLIGDAYASMNDRSARRPLLLDNPCVPRVLVLDDLGVERPTDYVIDQLGEVIMARYDAGLPVIVTSNHDLGTLASDSLAMDRISSRIAEMCKPGAGLIVRVSGQDRRVQA